MGLQPYEHKNLMATAFKDTCTRRGEELALVTEKDVYQTLDVRIGHFSNVLSETLWSTK